MKMWTYDELIENGYIIRNAKITSADLSMVEYACLSMPLNLVGDGWGVVYGGFVLGKKNYKPVSGSNGDTDYIHLFEGFKSGTEYIMTLMDIIGVEKLSELKGTYCRVALESWGTVKIIGNIIQDKWFDAGSFFEDKREK